MELEQIDAYHNKATKSPLISIGKNGGSTIRKWLAEEHLEIEEGEALTFYRTSGGDVYLEVSEDGQIPIHSPHSEGSSRHSWGCSLGGLCGRLGIPKEEGGYQLEVGLDPVMEDGKFLYPVEIINRNGGDN